ncbi:LOW QUALITY PROTEIN: colorectal cancer-associated protein 1 [Puma concolor]|uniref:LOW QUALITY PROTEIN: colorectal cancer-associated protein 1 n=1 Tax=Puma concolor TaxID=9696 RepID=A0A6P6IAK1_PUMCO|nr:LOW QUALITY PROTEIN: colorectal cancer-associated protein 1 [Puma concolor]
MGVKLEDETGLLSLLTSPFAWRWTEVVGGLSSLGNITEADADGRYVMFAEGRGGSGTARDEVLGSHRVFGTARSSVPSLRSLCLNHGSRSGGFCVGPAAGMDVPGLSLVSDFRKLGFLRPQPCLEKHVSQFLPQYEWNFVSCSFCNCKTPAQIFHVQISCLWMQGGVLSNESCESFPRICMCREVWSNQVYPETPLSWMVLTGDLFQEVVIY